MTLENREFPEKRRLYEIFAVLCAGKQKEMPEKNPRALRYVQKTQNSMVKVMESSVSFA